MRMHVLGTLTMPSIEPLDVGVAAERCGEPIDLVDDPPREVVVDRRPWCECQASTAARPRSEDLPVDEEAADQRVQSSAGRGTR